MPPRASGRTNVNGECVHGRDGSRPAFRCIPSVVAESRPQNVWVGLLARRCRACSAAASPSPADGRVVERSSALTHSGGTAPDSHRTSLLCPSWAPKQGVRYTTTAWTRQICGLTALAIRLEHEFHRHTRDSPLKLSARVPSVSRQPIASNASPSARRSGDKRAWRRKNRRSSTGAVRL